MRVHANDERLQWQGAVSVEHTPEGTQPWRVPYEDARLFPETLIEKAAMPAGVRLTFRSDTAILRGALTPHEASAPIDLYVDGERAGTAPLAGQEVFHFDGLPPGEKLIELWLPQQAVFRLRWLDLSDGATVHPHQDTRPRWITYGSSITQCAAAASPSQTWPAITARARNLHLTCLGYGGQCHLDSMIARMIRELPATYLSMCVGINIYGAGSLSPRSFRPAIIGFVQIVREKHPNTPYAVMSPIFSPPRETAKNRVDFTLQEMREEVATAVEILRAHGDQHLHYVNGLDVFGEELAHLLPDNLHPNAEGYRVMGQNFTQVVAERYFT
ncbi:MAG TPA: SGNH/GDSL hydrolase family protein [Chloroflexota bacterium]|nr:SGNH/GDSL hydrolase family protein [Chloroflexota bacterium]